MLLSSWTTRMRDDLLLVRLSTILYNITLHTYYGARKMYIYLAITLTILNPFFYKVSIILFLNDCRMLPLFDPIII